MKPITITVGRQKTASPDDILPFRPITLSDMPLINSMLQNSTTRTCDYTVGGIFMWVKMFDYRYCVIGDTLFIKGRSESHPDRTAFSLPIGGDLGEAVGLIADYCRLSGIKPSYSAIPEDYIDRLASLAGGRIERLEGWSDYIYSAEALATLSGKHYMKKRNHVNRFMTDNPAWTFGPLTADLVPETMLFLDGSTSTADKVDRAMADYERSECFRVLASLSSYPFEGAVLRGDDGAIVAFTLGEVIGDTLYTHIEKADHRVAGAGETVNKLFAAEMLRSHPGLRYINREEDMNDPGLRYAKESYRPVMLLDKYNLV